MTPTLTLNADGLSRAFQKLSEFSGVDVKNVIRAEAGQALKVCAARTKVASPSTVTVNERLRILRDLGFSKAANSSSTISINAGVRGPYGRAWRRTEAGKFQLTHAGANFAPTNYHYKKGDWIDLKEAVEDFRIQEKRRVPLARASAGLLRQSWIQIADDAGIDLAALPGGALSPAAIAKARAAIASNGRTYSNGQAAEFGENRDYVLRLINNHPRALKAGLDRTLIYALNGRAKFFQTNLEKGVFDTVRTMLRAYPALTVIAR